MSDESMETTVSPDASGLPDNNIGPKVDKIPENNIGPKMSQKRDNNIGPKIVSPPKAVNVSKANGPSFPIPLTITNLNGTALNWTARVNVGWVNLSHSGDNDLTPNQPLPFDANVDVSSLSVGVHSFELQTSFLSHMAGVSASITSTPITVNVVH